MSAVLEKTITEQTTNGVKPRLITVAEYDQMIGAGIYTENDRIELINGEIIQLMPKGTKHAYFNESIAEFFREILSGRVVVRSQNPIILDDLSEPEPDIALLRPPRENYRETHPTPPDIFLVMEISDTTLVYDRDIKALAYARGGIRQYLLLNLQNETIEDYREPNADGFGSKRTLRRSDSFNLVAFPEIVINTGDLLGN